MITSNNNLKHISQGLDQVMVDITVKCMLNPDNKDFYIGTLTLDKVKSLFVEMNDPDIDISTVFWKAYAIAERTYAELNAEPEEDVEETSDICPECGCPLYLKGCKCPNCDYIEEM